MAMLEVKDLQVYYGMIQAIKGVSFHVNEGEVIALIGANGAGKTTVFNLLTGVYKPTSGQITFDGKSILKMSPTQITQFGIARTFQNIRLFKNMSVIDNVKVGLHHSQNYSLIASVLHTPNYYKGEEAIEEMALSLLRVFDLDQYAQVKANNLPYGKQRKLEIARALASRPAILCLDEPAAGMNPTETEELMETIKIVREKFNTAILLIEHDMKLVMGICEWIKVISFGKEIATGTPVEIRNNKEVITAYLGE